MYLLLVTDYISNRQFIFDNKPLDVNQENFKMIFHEYVSKIQELHKGFDMYMNIVNNECEIYYFKENLTSINNGFDNNGQLQIKKSSFIKKIVYVLHFIPILLNEPDNYTDTNDTKDTNDTNDTKDINDTKEQGLSNDIKEEFISELVERLNLPKYGLSS
jgi:hypothetical protein